MNLAALTVAELDELHELLGFIDEDSKYNKLKYYEPETWQRNLYALCANEPVVLLSTANRMGKTYAATALLAMHLTGQYPDSYEGRKFTDPTNCVLLGVSYSQIMGQECSHDLLFGKPGELGTGFLPKDSIVSTTASGQSGAYGMAQIRHTSGGNSSLKIGTSSAGQMVLAGSSLDFVLCDEQISDKHVFQQALKRTLDRDGQILLVQTPELGMDPVLEMFHSEDSQYAMMTVSLFESERYTDEDKQRFVDTIPPWAHSYSIYGLVGAGVMAVMSGIDQDSVFQPIYEVPKHYKRLLGIDIGKRDMNVVAAVAYDEQTKHFYVYDEIATTDKDAVEVAVMIRPKQDKFVPMILPADSKQDRGAGSTIKKIYEDAGVICIQQNAANWNLDSEGKNKSVSAGVSWIRSLCKEGRLTIDPKCTAIKQSFEMYKYDEKTNNFIHDYSDAFDAMRYTLTAVERFGVTAMNDIGRNGMAYIPDEGW